MSRASLRVTALVAAVGAAACGSTTSLPPTPVQRTHLTVVRAVPTPATASASGAAPSGVGTPVAGAAGPATTGAATPAASAGPGALLAAAPGSYPVRYVATTQGGPPGSAPAHQGQGTLVVAPPSPVPQGTAQSLDLRGEGGFRITDDLLYPAPGGVLLTRSASTATSVCPAFVLDPDQPIVVVPARLAPGVVWGPTAFHTSSLQGSYSGSVEGQGSDTVGGDAVSVWHLRLTIDITQGSYCGYQFHGTIDQSGDWAPSLHLQVASHTVSTLTFTAFGTVTETTDEQLLADRPS